LCFVNRKNLARAAPIHSLLQRSINTTGYVPLCALQSNLADLMDL
jgi:hypothetical protein